MLSAKRSEDFESIDDYRNYQKNLAKKTLLAYGVVLEGKAYGRVQEWTEDLMNLNQDVMHEAQREVAYNPRFKRIGSSAAGWELTAGALPASAEEQKVIDIVQTLADSTNRAEQAVMSDVTELRVPNVDTATQQRWQRQTQEFFHQRDAAFVGHYDQ